MEREITGFCLVLKFSEDLNTVLPLREGDTD